MLLIRICPSVWGYLVFSRE